MRWDKIHARRNHSTNPGRAMAHGDLDNKLNAKIQREKDEAAAKKRQEALAA